MRCHQGSTFAAARSAERVAFVDKYRLRFPARAVPALRVVHVHRAIKTLNKRESGRPQNYFFALVLSGSSPGKRQKRGQKPRVTTCDSGASKPPRSLSQAKGEHRPDPKSLKIPQFECAKLWPRGSFAARPVLPARHRCGQAVTGTSRAAFAENLWFLFFQGGSGSPPEPIGDV